MDVCSGLGDEEFARVVVPACLSASFYISLSLSLSLSPFPKWKFRLPFIYRLFFPKRNCQNSVCCCYVGQFKNVWLVGNCKVVSGVCSSKIMYYSKIETPFFFLFFFLGGGYQKLYGTVRQHDNARPHAARNTTQFLASTNVQILPWPSLSPNFNKTNTLGTTWRDVFEAEWTPL